MLGQQRLDDSTHTIAIPVAGDRDSASPHGWDRSHRTAQSRATWLGWRRMGERSGRQGAGWCWVCMDGSGLQSAVQRIGQRRASAKASQSHPEPLPEPLPEPKTATASAPSSGGGPLAGARAAGGADPLFPLFRPSSAAEVLLPARAAASRYLRGCGARHARWNCCS